MVADIGTLPASASATSLASWLSAARLVPFTVDHICRGLPVFGSYPTTTRRRHTPGLTSVLVPRTPGDSRHLLDARPAMLNLGCRALTSHFAEPERGIEPLTCALRVRCSSG